MNLAPQPPPLRRLQPPPRRPRPPWPLRSMPRSWCMCIHIIPAHRQAYTTSGSDNCCGPRLRVAVRLRRKLPRASRHRASLMHHRRDSRPVPVIIDVSPRAIPGMPRGKFILSRRHPCEPRPYARQPSLARLDSCSDVRVHVRVRPERAYASQASAQEVCHKRVLKTTTERPPGGGMRSTERTVHSGSRWLRAGGVSVHVGVGYSHCCA